MVCLVAGDPTAVEIVKPVLYTIGRATIVIGEDVAQGTLTRRVLVMSMVRY
jgi:3-hydroxyisobutyrate dehydrogenase-like beta-hydroxyacid dehydrogenase